MISQLLWSPQKFVCWRYCNFQGIFSQMIIARITSYNVCYTKLLRRVSSLDGLVYSEGQVILTVEGENDAPYIYDIDYYVVTDEDTSCQVNFMAFDYEDDESTSDGKETTYTFTTDIV